MAAGVAGRVGRAGAVRRDPLPAKGQLENDGQLNSDPASVEFEAIEAQIFAENKLSEASSYVAGLSLDNFFQGDHKTAKSQKHMNKHAKKAKRRILHYLKHAAREVRKSGHDSRCHHHKSAAHLEKHERYTLKTIGRALQTTDGLALRSTPDVKGSGFPGDLIIGTTSSVLVFDCLNSAATAIQQ